MMTDTCCFCGFGYCEQCTTHLVEQVSVYLCICVAIILSQPSLSSSSANPPQLSTDCRTGWALDLTPKHFPVVTCNKHCRLQVAITIYLHYLPPWSQRINYREKNEMMEPDCLTHHLTSWVILDWLLKLVCKTGIIRIPTFWHSSED